MMPITNHEPKTHLKGLGGGESRSKSGFNPDIAGVALAKGLIYLKARLEWSGAHIARILHIHPNTVNNWLKHTLVPISSASLTPDVQAVIHLLAIHRSLEAMFEDPAYQRAWLETLHPAIEAVPEEKMSESMDGLIFIRQYLDYARGRGA